MKLRITTQCLVKGKVLNVGEIIEVSPLQARQLVELERAVPHVEAEGKPAAPKTEVKPAKGK